VKKSIKFLFGVKNGEDRVNCRVYAMWNQELEFGKQRTKLLGASNSK